MIYDKKYFLRSSTVKMSSSEREANVNVELAEVTVPAPGGVGETGSHDHEQIPLPSALADENVSTDQALAQANLRLQALLAEQEEQKRKKEQLARLLDQCRAAEATNAQLSRSLAVPAHVPSRAGSSTIAAADTLISLHQPRTASGGTTAAAPRINLNNIRQVPDIREEVDNRMHSLGLVQGQDVSSSSRDSSDSEDERRRRRRKDKKKSSRRHQSGKVKKVTSYVKYPEVWPHTELVLHFVGRPKEYEELTIQEFVAGYTAIVQSESCPVRSRHRLAHLKKLMYYATVNTWPSVLNFHAAVLMDIERGRLAWGDKFDEQTSTTLVPIPRSSKSTKGGVGGGDSSKNQPRSVRWCKLYQTGQCTQAKDHEGELGGAIRLLRHICAKCWSQSKTFGAHPQSSPDCPLA